jgi:hypothetical protein
VTAFGNAPSISRNSTDATRFVCHASLIVASSKCTESVVERPGCPPKWFAGRSWCFSRMLVTCLVIMAVSSLHVVLINAMGRYALGTL